MRRTDLHEDPAKALGKLIGTARGAGESAQTRPTGQLHLGDGDAVWEMPDGSSQSAKRLAFEQAELDAALKQLDLDLATKTEALKAADEQLKAAMEGLGTVVGSQEPSDPIPDQLWIDNGSGSVIIRRYDADSGTWVAERFDGTTITDGSIGTNQLAANSVTAAQIAAGAVRAAQIAAEAIVAGHLTAGVVTTPKIAAGAITAETLATNAVTANKIAADAIDGKTIRGATIIGGQVTTSTTAGTRVTMSPAGSSGWPGLDIWVSGISQPGYLLASASTNPETSTTSGSLWLRGPTNDAANNYSTMSLTPVSVWMRAKGAVDSWLSLNSDTPSALRSPKGLTVDSTGDPNSVVRLTRDNALFELNSGGGWLRATKGSFTMEVPDGFVSMYSRDFFFIKNVDPANASYSRSYIWQDADTWIKSMARGGHRWMKWDINGNQETWMELSRDYNAYAQTHWTIVNAMRFNEADHSWNVIKRSGGTTNQRDVARLAITGANDIYGTTERDVVHGSKPDGLGGRWGSFVWMKQNAFDIWGDGAKSMVRGSVDVEIQAMNNAARVQLRTDKAVELQASNTNTGDMGATSYFRVEPPSGGQRGVKIPFYNRNFSGGSPLVFVNDFICIGSSRTDLKEDITPVNSSGVLDLQLVSWVDKGGREEAARHLAEHGSLDTLRMDPDETQIGFLAEEVEKHVPEIATYAWDETNVKRLNGIQYDRIGALLQPHVADHERRINDLEQRLAALT